MRFLEVVQDEKIIRRLYPRHNGIKATAMTGSQAIPPVLPEVIELRKYQRGNIDVTTWC